MRCVITNIRLDFGYADTEIFKRFFFYYCGTTRKLRVSGVVTTNNLFNVDLDV